MAIPYTQASMALVRAVDGTFISYPFISDGDTTTKVYNLVCTQRASDYNAAQIDLDDNMSSAANAGVIDLPSGWADSNAYFVGDTGHAPSAGGMISFTRTFANIPQSTTIASGSAFVTFPGIFGFRTAEPLKTISDVKMTVGNIGVTITTTEAHDLIVGDNVNITMGFTIGSDPFIHSVSGNFLVLTAPSTTTFSIDIGYYWGEQVGLTLDSGTLVEGPIQRSPISKNQSTLTRYDYILPGVTPGISSTLDINLPPVFSVTSVVTGETTSTTSDGGGAVGTTIPTSTQYVDMIANDANIVIESSLAEWAGNILVQKTKTCKAR